MWDITRLRIFLDKLIIYLHSHVNVLSITKIFLQHSLLLLLAGCGSYCLHVCMGRGKGELQVTSLERMVDYGMGQEIVTVEAQFKFLRKLERFLVTFYPLVEYLSESIVQLIIKMLLNLFMKRKSIL